MRQYTANPARYQPTTVSGFTMTTASDHRDHSRRSTTQNARSTGPISGPEKSAPMIAQKCRSMEVGEAAGAGTNRQHFSMERGFGEAQGTPRGAFTRDRVATRRTRHHRT